MKINRLAILAGLLLLLFLTGCQGDNKPAVSTEDELPIDSEQPLTDPRGVDIEWIKTGLDLDMTKSEVEEVLGSQFSVVIDAMDGNEMWRYDFGEQEGYSNEEEMDFVDLDGLEAGEIIAQVFVGWDGEHKVKDYSIYFVHRGGKIHQYSVYGRDFIKEGPIN